VLASRVELGFCQRSPEEELRFIPGARNQADADGDGTETPPGYARTVGRQFGAELWGKSLLTDIDRLFHRLLLRLCSYYRSFYFVCCRTSRMSRVRTCVWFSMFIASLARRAGCSTVVDRPIDVICCGGWAISVCGGGVSGSMFSFGLNYSTGSD
jgi:hypothetical protein